MGDGTSPTGPTLTRLGGGRMARGAAVAALALFGALVWAGSLEDAPDEPATLPTPTQPAVAEASAAPLPTTRRDASRRGGGDATWFGSPMGTRGGHFEAAMLRDDLDYEPVRLISLRQLQHRAAIDLPPRLWRDLPMLEVAWSDGRPGGRRDRLAVVQLSFGDGSDGIGLPSELAGGPVVLPAPIEGTRHWMYAVLLDRAPSFMPDALMIDVRLEPSAADTGDGWPCNAPHLPDLPRLGC